MRRAERCVAGFKVGCAGYIAHGVEDVAFGLAVYSFPARAPFNFVFDQRGFWRTKDLEVGTACRDISGVGCGVLYGSACIVCVAADGVLKLGLCCVGEQCANWRKYQQRLGIAILNQADAIYAAVLVR